MSQGNGRVPIEDEEPLIQGTRRCTRRAGSARSRRRSSRGSRSLSESLCLSCAELGIDLGGVTKRLMLVLTMQAAKQPQLMAEADVAGALAVLLGISALHLFLGKLHFGVILGEQATEALRHTLGLSAAKGVQEDKLLALRSRRMDRRRCPRHVMDVLAPRPADVLWASVATPGCLPHPVHPRLLPHPHGRPGRRGGLLQRWAAPGWHRRRVCRDSAPCAPSPAQRRPPPKPSPPASLAAFCVLWSSYLVAVIFTGFVEELKGNQTLVMFPALLFYAMIAILTLYRR